MNIVNVGYDSTNYYVLEQQHGAANRPSTARVLIDVGFPGTLPKLRALLKRMDIALASINYLLCTHYHPDHAGLAQEMKAQGVRLVVMEPQVAAIPQMARFLTGRYPYVPITLQDSVVLAIGESRAFLQKLGMAGEIVHTPGHSDDSVSLVLDTGIAFTGDMPRPIPSATGAGHDDAGNNDIAGDNMTNDAYSVKAAVSGWERLRALHVTRLYPGHGPVLPFRFPL